MKNIFRFMGVALMATSLMVACGTKEGEEDDPINDNPGTEQPTDNPTPTPQQGTFAITWNGTDMTSELESVDAIADPNQFSGCYVFEFLAAKSETEFPEFDVYFINNGSSILTPDQVWYKNQDGDTVSALYDFPAGVCITGTVQIGPYDFPEFGLYRYNNKLFSDFDATKMMIGCNLDMQFFNYGTLVSAMQEYEQEHQYPEDGTAEEQKEYEDAESDAAYTQALQNGGSMTLTLTNYIFAEGQIK